MRVIVTGGAGFLGRHLCRALAQAGHQVRVIDLRENSEFPSTIADVRDAAQMLAEIKEAEVVFHLAALIEAGESVKQPQKFVDTNITGTLTVLEAMRQNQVPAIVFSSSAAVYGEPQQVPIKEDSRTIPINPYGVTKLATEGLISSYVAAHGITGVSLRYFNLFGPEEMHQPETHAIPRFIKQIYNNEEVTIWGNGEHQRDYIFIADVVQAHLDALNLIAAQPHQYHYFNISTEQPTPVSKVVETIAQLLNKPAKIKNFPPRPGDPMVLSADAGKAHTQLNWRAKVTLEEGLRQTVTYFTSLWQK